MIGSVELGQRIGYNLGRYAKTQKLSHGSIAARVGLSQPSVSDLIAGKTREPKLSTLLKFTTVLPGLEITDLLADVTPQDLAETEAGGGAEDRLLALERENIDLKRTVARIDERLATVLDLLPPLVAERPHGDSPPPRARGGQKAR